MHFIELPLKGLSSINKYIDFEDCKYILVFLLSLQL